MQKFNVGEYTDCPVFDGLYEFCATYTGIDFCIYMHIFIVIYVYICKYVYMYIDIYIYIYMYIYICIYKLPTGNVNFPYVQAVLWMVL
jgi:hypothetical protein